MPSYSTHCIFARELLPQLYTSVDFDLNEEALMVGTQGPDIFFFHRVFPWMPGKSKRKIGSALHRSKPADILENMRDYCNKRSKQKDIAKSYVHGFIMHYALDRLCHPYVYSLQYKIVEKSPLTNPHTAHNTVEFSMDTYLLNKRYGIAEPALFDTACTVCEDEKVLAEIGKLYAYVVPRVLGIKISETTAATAVKDMKRVQAATFDATGMKRKFLYAAETMIAPFSKNYKFSAMLRPRDLEKAKKYGNIDNSNWQSPFDNSYHNESFEDLFEIAKLDAKRLIADFSNGANLYKATNNLSFLTGVEVK